MKCDVEAKSKALPPTSQLEVRLDSRLAVSALEEFTPQPHKPINRIAL